MIGVFFSADNLVLTVAQSICVGLPAAGLPRWTARFRTRAWALILPLCIAGVVAAIELLPSTATVLTYVALILVPAGAALALGWAARGARPWAALLVVPLFAAAWAVPDARWGQAAATVLIVGSAVTAGRLLAGAAPQSLLKAGVVAMAVIDAVLVFSENLQPASAVLGAAAPGAGLPQLQSASFGRWGLGYGDFFAAAVVGGILALEGRHLWRAAAVTLAVGLAWDQLFLAFDTLPATVPPAIVLLAYEVRRDGGRRAPAVPVGSASHENGDGGVTVAQGGIGSCAP